MTASVIENVMSSTDGDTSAAKISTACLVTLLHEGTALNSSNRQLAGKPVLYWTLKRLINSANHDYAVAVAYWDDQAEGVGAVVDELQIRPRIYLHSHGKRRPDAALDLVKKARRWADGWRGGLLSTCWFDLGFHPGVAACVAQTLGVVGVVSLPAESPLVQTDLIVGLCRQFDQALQNQRDDLEVFFSSAAPGLCGVLVSSPFLARQNTLKHAWVHPGGQLHYRPESPRPDPLSSQTCVPAAAALTRTTERFHCNSARQVRFLESILSFARSAPDAITTDEIISALAQSREAQDRNVAEPRDVQFEITTRRNSRPVFSAYANLALAELANKRADVTLPQVRGILSELSGIDDLRLTLTGMGDPLLHPDFPNILGMFCDAGIACCVETDLLELTDLTLSALLRPNVDVIWIHIPAASAGVYSQVMGTDADGLKTVLHNLKVLAEAKEAMAKKGVTDLPILVPCFTKCTANLAEMEPWYDHFLKVLGAAVIVGASTLAGQIAGHSPADLSPPLRRPCRRLGRSMVILSDGTVVPCDQDPSGLLSMGNAFVQSGPDERLISLWRQGTRSLRYCHEQSTTHSGVALPQLCSQCTEWHRP